MSFKASKFRHARPHLAGTSEQFLDVAPFTSGSSQLLAASGRWLAVVWSNGNSVALLRVAEAGKRGTPQHFLRAHGRPITALCFDPKEESTLATASEDCSVRVWAVPREGLSEDVTQPQAHLKGHQKKVVCLAFHPTAAHLLASGGFGGRVVVWNTRDATALFTLQHPKPLWSVAWDASGARLLSTGQDLQLRVFDPRASGEQAVYEAPAHQGNKASSCVWLGQGHRFLTAGFSKMRERQLYLWDLTKEEKRPLAKHTLDSSTGVLTLAFDPTCNLLWCGGRGDSTLKVLEIGESKPYFTSLETAGCPNPQLAFCMLPKRAVDVLKYEVGRVYRLSRSAIVPISYRVSRKLRRFYPELYPDAPAAQAVCSAEEWLAGNSDPPALISMDPASRPKDAEEASKAAGGGAAPDDDKKDNDNNSNSNNNNNDASSGNANNDNNSGSASDSSGFIRTNDVWKTEKKPTRDEVIKSYEDVSYRSPKVVRSSKYRHIFGKPVPQREQVTGISHSRTTADGNLIAGNRRFFAVPTEGPGGRIAVIPTSFTGRLPDNYSTVETGSVVLDFAFHRFHENLLITGHEDAHIKVWTLPEGGLDLEKKENFRQHSLDLTGHRRKVTSLSTHPTAAGILAAADGANCLKIWDIDAGKEAFSLTDAVEPAYNLAWNYDGSTLATISHDAFIRLFDPRQQGEVKKGAAHATGKSSRVLWTDKERLLSVGFGKGSARQIRLYDSRKLEVALKTFEIDIASGVLTPHYDQGNGVLFVAGKGDANVRFFEITDSGPMVHFLTQYTSSDPQADVCFLPKQSCDIAGAEIAHMLKLHNANRVEPVRFYVPRKRKQFFQDDLYPPTPALKSSMSSSQWIAGENADPILESLQPEGMVPLSRAPAEKRTSRPSSAYFLAQASGEGPLDAAAQAEKTQAALFAKVTSLHKEDGTKQENEDQDGVDSDEWSD